MKTLLLLNAAAFALTFASAAAAFLSIERNEFVTRSLSSFSEKNVRIPVSSLHATIRFEGNSRDSLHVTMPPGSTGSLPDWLNRSESNAALLGTEECVERPDGLWDCKQPNIGWFGLSLSPVFVNKIDKHSATSLITVTIVDARTEILSGSQRAGTVLSEVMEKSNFVGNNQLKLKEVDSNIWTLASDFTLTLLVPLPRFIFLPPGFNRIGSSIVQSTCRQRVKRNLEDIRDAYLLWAEQMPTSVES